MSKEGYISVALGLLAGTMAIMQWMFPDRLPAVIGWPIVAVSGIGALILFIIGLRKKTQPKTNDQTATESLIIWINSYCFELNPDRYKPKDPKAVILGMLVYFNALAPVRIEGIELELLGNLYQSDYQLMERPDNGKLGAYIYFELPSDFKTGQYTVHIVAHVGGRKIRSKDPYELLYKTYSNKK